MSVGSLTGTGRRLGTGVVVAGASLASRVLALALLVPAARFLSEGDFGRFALVVGISVSVTGVLGSVFGDVTASGAVLHAVRTWRRTAAAVLALAVSGLLGCVVVLVVDGTPGVWLTAILLTTTGLAPFLAMHLLRGLGRPATGAVLAFLVLPSARLVAVLAFTGGADGARLRELLDLLLWAAVGSAVVALAVVWTHRPDGLAAGTVLGSSLSSPALVAGFVVATAFTVIGQTALVSVAMFLGDAATADYAPTARVCEALTAVGVGYQFVTSRSSGAAGDAQLPVRVVGLLAVPYGVAAILMLLVAPTVFPVLLGQGHVLDVGIALALVPAFFCTMMSAVEIQRLFLLAHHRRIVLASGVAVVVAGVTVPLVTSFVGAVGAAAATAAAAAVWWVALRSGSAAVTPC